MNLEEVEKKFCRECGQRLKEASVFQRLQGQTNYYEFEDGVYCFGCAKDRIQKVRGKK